LQTPESGPPAALANDIIAQIINDFEVLGLDAMVLIINHFL
jgi:hypothetical protein